MKFVKYSIANPVVVRMSAVPPSSFHIDMAICPKNQNSAHKQKLDPVDRLLLNFSFESSRNFSNFAEKAAKKVFGNFVEIFFF